MVGIRTLSVTITTGALTALVVLSTAANAGTVEGTKAQQPPENYSAGVRWFFMTLDREVPAHRLAEHLVRHVAAKIGGEVAIEGKHVDNDFPAGAWLATSVPPAQVHTLVRQRAKTLGNFGDVGATQAEDFPITAHADILDLRKRGSLVDCHLRLKLQGAEGKPIDTTRFTGHGGPPGMHVFTATIPERLVQRRLPKGANTPGTTYLVITVNVGTPWR